MSDQNSPTPDPSDAVPGYTPPAASEPAARRRAARLHPAGSRQRLRAPGRDAAGLHASGTPGGYEPPAATPPAYTPPPTGGYEPRPRAPTPLPPQVVTPSRPLPAVATPSRPASRRPPRTAARLRHRSQRLPGGGVPNMPLAPVGGAPLADWPKRALGGLIDYVAPGVVISIVANLLAERQLHARQRSSARPGLGWWVYLGYKTGTTGVTFGRSIAKTKLISRGHRRSRSASATASSASWRTSSTRSSATSAGSSRCGTPRSRPLPTRS